MIQKMLIWFGDSPLPGIIVRLEGRGFTLLHNPDDKLISNQFLGVTAITVFSHVDNENLAARYKHIPQLINHGVKVIVIASRSHQIQIIENLQKMFCREFDWQKNLIFIPDVIGTNFDNFINGPSAWKWRGLPVRQNQADEQLNQEEGVLIGRAFPNAEELHVSALTQGLSGSKVLIVYEKRIEKSIAHYAQPRLVKIGNRSELEREVGYMQAVAPFVPFELRPNLTTHIEGFNKSLFIADFVEKSESMLEAARAGRAEAAISNLFNRTLYRWRDMGWQKNPAQGSLAEASEKLGVFDPSKIKLIYKENQRIENLNLDFGALWEFLKSIKFPHRVASIHGDLHGENVRVRGDDAILIDFGSVRGAEHGDAPLCFDVAMLEVALVFSSTSEDPADSFVDEHWEESILPYYDLEAVRRTPKRDTLPNPTSWLFGCIHRIRAFAIYDQTDPYEYAIALSIALWRWCKFQPKTTHDKGRRVVALEIGAKIIKQIQEQRK